MTFYQKPSEKVDNYREYRYFTSGQMGGLAREKTSRLSLERDKKTRREIANSNERRRMQSINSGFQQLKALLPDTEDDKRSKSVILHQTVELITKLESEKINLLNQNSKLMRIIQQEMDGKIIMKRKRLNSAGDENDVDDIISPLVVESKLDAYYQADNIEMIGKVERLIRELRTQLEEERKKRLACERQLDSIKAALRSSSSLVSSVSSSSLLLSPPSSLSSLSPVTNFIPLNKSQGSSASLQIIQTPTTSSLLTVTTSPHGLFGSWRIEEDNKIFKDVDGDYHLNDKLDCNKPDDDDGQDQHELVSDKLHANQKQENKEKSASNAESSTSLSEKSPLVSGELIAVDDVNKGNNVKLTSKTAVECSLKRSGTMTYSMSRRNLETIVEAIKHLEGDQELPISAQTTQPKHDLIQQTQQQSSVIHPNTQHLNIQQQLIQSMKSPIKHYVQKKSTSSLMHQVLKQQQHNKEKTFPIIKNLQVHLQPQQQPPFISFIQPSSPFCSPLSSPPLSSTPPEMTPYPLNTTHHFLSPVIICSPNSTFLKGTSQLTPLTTLDQS